jgi:Dullard-like phosphatase family protein
LVSLINENFLLILSHQVFIKEPLQENNSCANLQKDFIESYSKIIKQKKIKKNYKEQLTAFCNNINKNLEIVISTVKQFSNNFFKIGYFNPIHNIFLDIFRLIDNYKVEDIANIIINNVLYFILKSSQNDKKNYAPKLVSFTPGTNPLAALGFINVPSPFLKKLPPEIETSTYTLVLDLDETLVHFFYTPSGGTFLIRPFCSQFLEEMAKIFEIVIFTAALKDYADSILDILDPNKILINYRLYRHHTSLSGITFCKDLSKIGRDLSRTLIIDNLADNFKLQPSNGILIGTWIDDMKDTQLNDLGKILKILVSKKPNDVRPIIKKFKEDMNKKMRNNMNINPFKGIDITKYIK